MGSVLVNKKGHSRHPSHDFVGSSVATLKEQLIKVDLAKVNDKLEKPADDTFTTADDSVTNENQALAGQVPGQPCEAAPQVVPSASQALSEQAHSQLGKTVPSASPAPTHQSQAAPQVSTSASLLK